MSNKQPSLPTEWEALNDMDQAIIALQSVVSLSRVLGGTNDEWRHSATYEDAMFAFTTYLETCVERASVCKEMLFKCYRERKNIPELDPNAWQSPAATLAGADNSVPTQKKNVTLKKGKKNGK